MAIEKIKELVVPKFDLPQQYSNDIWDIPSWDIYTNADEKSQLYWRQRSGITDYKIDFSTCVNIVVREELKYGMYHIIKDKTNLRTIGEKYDFLKHVINFFNAYEYESIIDVDNQDYENYIASVGLQIIVKDGKRAYSTEGKMLRITKRNGRITFFESIKKDIIDYYNPKSLNKYENDIWYANDFQILDEHIDSNRKIDFSKIKNKEFKNTLKKFCENRLQYINFVTTSAYIIHISNFLIWLEDNFPSITHLNELNRDIMEDYFVWLRTKSGYSQKLINKSILELKKFFEIGILLEFDNFPSNGLIISTDYAFKSQKEANPFIDSELQSIIKIIPKMPKLYGKMLYCLMTLGCRISEIVYLSVDSLKQYPDEKYYLVLKQFKTKAIYEKSIPDSAAQIMLSEIKKNKKLFGDELKYVFINSKNKPISFSTLNQNINKALILNNVLDRDGKPLHCNTHRFRATLATNLLNSGYDVETTGKLLGQKCLKSLGYYANVTNEKAKEQLKGRFEKDNLLISNIGKIDDKVLSDYKNPIPLCNGWCVKSPSLGICKKANHCLECNMFAPTLSYLSMYEMQLKEVEASIAIAKSNNMDLVVEKNLKTKASLEKIISKIRERRNTNE